MTRPMSDSSSRSKIAAISVAAACLALVAIGAVLVWTYPQQPADWYWFTGRVLVAIPLAILVIHAGAQGMALGKGNPPSVSPGSLPSA